MFSNSKRVVLSLTVLAAATTQACRAIDVTGSYPAIGGAMFGVSDFDAEAGDELNLDVMGTSILECSAVVNKNDLIQVTTADGKFGPKGAGKAVARALSATTAPGQKFEALLLPANT